ncbi:DUF6350 family protein [Rhodococcus gannanensis]|uniref:DUF6350 family protein n=1 Tax=Rhodococcus gannanensis TaxID=1960308 RepID=A0ABW4NXL5_9NOCA
MNSVVSRGGRRPDGGRRPLRAPAAGLSGRPTPTPEQMRALLGVALRPALLALVVIATCMVVTLVAANSDLTGTSGSIAAGWLALHQVPLTIGGASLGALPLLPTLVMIAAVARGCSRVVTASTPRHECWWVVGAAVAGPVVVTAIALAVVADASSVIPLSSPNVLAALAWVIAVHLIGAGIGIGIRLWRPIVTLLGVPDWVLAAARPATRSGMALLATGAAITAASLVASWSTVGMLIEAGDGFMGGLGLTLLSILYLPNVVIGATAVLVGSAVEVGSASVSLFDVVGGPVPALPVLGALPEQAGGDGWLVGLVVPAAVGVMFGRECARRASSPLSAVQTALVGALAVATVFAALGFAAGGAVGSFGSVGVDLLTFVGATFGWLAVFGSAAAAVTRLRGAPDRTAPARRTPMTPAATAELPPTAELPAAAEAATRPERGESTVIDAELLDDDGQALPAPDSEAAADAVVDAEVVDDDEDGEKGVAQVTDEDARSDLPDGRRTSKD